MANMYPTKVDQFASPAEEMIYNKIRIDFPNDIDVYYSVNFIKNDNKDGECDFILIDKNRGITFLEIKGSRFVGAVNGDFYSGKRKTKSTDPYLQAKNAMYQIIEHLKENVSEKDKKKIEDLGMRKIVVFPTTNDLSNFGSLMTFDPSITITKEKYDFNFFENYVKIWNDLPFMQGKISKDLYESITNILRPTVTYIQSDSLEVDTISFQIEKYTNEQNEANLRIQDHDKIRIHGGPGTGKTKLAVFNALEFSNNKQRTLFLCFSKLLSENIKKEINDLGADKNYIDIFHFEELLEMLAKKNNLEFNQKKLDEEIYINELFYDINFKPEYNVLIIDEAQDFSVGSDWIEILEDILIDDENKRYLLFHDDNQQLFSDNNLNLNGFFPYSLDTNLRNTKEIHQLVKKFYNGGRYLPKKNLSYKKIDYNYSDSNEKSLQYIQEFINENNDLLGNTTILTVDNEDKKLLINSSLKEKMSLNYYLRKDKIYISNIRDFKGLESDIIIVFSNGKFIEEKLFYTAISRAKVSLMIIIPKEMNKLLHN